MVRFTQLHPSFAAETDDIDLSARMSDVLRDELIAAMDLYAVCILRNYAPVTCPMLSGGRPKTGVNYWTC